ncbi:MAG: hypothetical protein D6743_04205 [Calditrichaeota bacterium]|nr:MAG: hypothetical protein D6743_04205 [Calditrichota bacterium]
MSEQRTKANGEIAALVTLLGDADPHIRQTARARLLNLGEAAAEHLRQAITSDGEGRIRIEAGVVLEELRLRRLAAAFHRLSLHTRCDLEQACFILAQIEYPELDIRGYVRKLDRLAQEAGERIFNIRDGLRKVEAINSLLFFDLGFRGNTRAYYDPQNSYVNRVLDRRLGIPISLSAVYLFVARRLGLPIEGVGFPGHFLLKYDDGCRTFYIDAFNRGQILYLGDCQQYLSHLGYPFHETYLQVSGPREILARMIRNLVLIYHQKNQHHKIDTLEQIFSDFVTT